MTLANVIAKVKPSVVRLAFFRDDEQVGDGSAFLSSGWLVTNSHVIRGGQYSAVELTFGDQGENPIDPVRIHRDDFLGRVKGESQKSEFDYAVLDLSAEPEFNGRWEFEVLKAEGAARVGDQVLFFGFPFGGTALTSHVGYISADYRSGNVHMLQIDGSINPGNSGGPLYHLESGKVIGIVTRTETGLERDFDELAKAIEGNERVLAAQRGGIVIGGVDPVRATRVTMAILRRVATNLSRSANVGIGWAFCCEHLLGSGKL